jgi:hypothetical protein
MAKNSELNFMKNMYSQKIKVIENRSVHHRTCLEVAVIPSQISRHL